MPNKRYKAEQIVTLLRQIEVGIANGKTTPQVCKEAEITVQTYYRWRKEYGAVRLPVGGVVSGDSGIAHNASLLDPPNNSSILGYLRTSHSEWSWHRLMS